MKRLSIVFAILTPWITLPMEPEVMSIEATQEPMAEPERAGSWVRFFDKTVPGYRFHETGFHPKGEITRVLAQEVLRRRPQMREYIISQIAVPFDQMYYGSFKITHFNRTGDKVVTTTNNFKAKILEAETGILLHTLKGHTGHVLSAVFNPTGDKVVTASGDGTAKIWDTATGRLLHTLSGHTDWVRLAQFNSTGDKITTTSLDKTARIWDLRAFLETEQFLAEDITLQQVALLLDIFEVRSARHYLTALKQEFPEKGTSLRPEGITFDFNRYPDLWNDYEKLPEAMRTIFDPYVTKLTSEQGWWGAVNSRLYAILYWINGKLGQH